MIPPQVLPAIEATRESVAKSIQRFADFASKTEAGKIPILLNPHVASPGKAELPSSAENFEFWTIPDEETYSRFMEDLSMTLDMLELDASVYDQLPLGYGITRYVLRFETHCKFSSWMAVENVGPEEMEVVRHYYCQAGMAEEAEALSKAESAWYAVGGDENGGYAAAGEAYSSVPNPNKDEDDRWFRLLDHLRPPPTCGISPSPDFS